MDHGNAKDQSCFDFVDIRVTESSMAAVIGVAMAAEEGRKLSGDCGLFLESNFHTSSSSLDLSHSSVAVAVNDIRLQHPLR
eukprot:CAMPEP_0176157264 /NCGR_PEP_ID=MMETSP0120_2-20121206/80398_1 /TAXON_ID=160619 /ORGANISM="Kryptoperidinium foliaceum, Strain CCMP 1326" /LENGTH=80 /DNA_ID=CAMNT_0017494529 /DNA_START=118 /DNA_END=360 /DNA_ORIENTATION=-